VISWAALTDQRGPKPGLGDAVLLPEPQDVLLETGEHRRLPAGHATIDAKFVDHVSTGCIGVLMVPGATAFTLMPSFAYSIASDLVAALKPPLVSEASTAHASSRVRSGSS
jgi:hypothetical protein